MNAPDYLTILRQKNKEKSAPSLNCINRVKDFVQFTQFPPSAKKDNSQKTTPTTKLSAGKTDTTLDDDRRSCNQCANLIGRRCQAAKRGEIVARKNFEPIRTLFQRCEGYAPGKDDLDRRHGRDRWRSRIYKGDE
jgi:hypothetical protein